MAGLVDGAHGQLRLLRRPELADQHDVERTGQPLRNRTGHRHAAAGNGENQRPLRLEPQELLGQQAGRLVPVRESHAQSLQALCQRHRRVLLSDHVRNRRCDSEDRQELGRANRCAAGGCCRCGDARWSDEGGRAERAPRRWRAADSRTGNRGVCAPRGLFEQRDAGELASAPVRGRHRGCPAARPVWGSPRPCARETAPSRTQPHPAAPSCQRIGSQNVVFTTNRFGPGAVTERNMSPMFT